MNRIQSGKPLRTLSVVGIVLLLAACANIKPSVPAGYVGPTAILKDSAKAQSTSKVEFFFVESINGDEVENSMYATRGANFGHGMSTTPVVVQRPIVVAPLRIAIVGRTDYAAPIQEMLGTVYEVKGVVDLTPEAGKTYVVRGELGETYSAVWIEDEASGTVIDKKIEIRGSAKLGILQK